MIPAHEVISGSKWGELIVERLSIEPLDWLEYDLGRGGFLVSILPFGHIWSVEQVGYNPIRIHLFETW